MSALTEREASAIGTPHRVHSVRVAAGAVILALIFALDVGTPFSVLAAPLYVLVIYIAQYESATTQPKIIAAICTLLTLVGGLLASSQELPQWTGIVSRLMAVAVIWGLLEFDIPLRRANSSLRRRCDLEILPQQENVPQVQELTLRLVNAAESERRALSRELHDRVGGSLTALNFAMKSVISMTRSRTTGKLRNGSTTTGPGA